MIGRLIALVVCVLAGVALYFAIEKWHPAPEQEVMIYRPGTYQGRPDTPLDKEQEQELRSRVRNQNPI